MGYWRNKAKRIITQAFREAQEKNLRGRAVRRYITQQYESYGHPRAKYPYRVWLEEVEAVMQNELAGQRQTMLPLGL